MRRAGRSDERQLDARSAAARVLDRTLASRAPAETFLEPAGRQLSERDRRLLRELVLGSLRWRRRLEQVAERAASRSFERIDPEIRAPLLVGIYQLLFLDRVPAHAAVSEAVAEAKRRSHRGAAGFVNALLRRVAAAPRLDAWPLDESDPVRRLAIETSHPELLVRRWRASLGAESTERMLRANNRVKPFHLLSFRDRGGREALAAELAAEGVATVPSEVSPTGLVVREGDPRQTVAFRRGDLYLQDEASQLAAQLPPPRPGERILDVAAAPGGKTFAIQALEPAARVVAADRSPARIATLDANLRRLGRSVPRLVADARRVPFALPSGAAPGFDRVVVDLPCSGTGTIRKHPELKWRVSEEEIRRLADESAALLAAVAPFVRPGGLLVAITCSVEPEEGVQLLDRCVEESGGTLRPLPLTDLLPSRAADHLLGPGSWRLLPGDDHDGFSVQVMIRSE